MKIIFLSAYAEFEYAQGAIANRVSGYLLKPLDEEELEALIRKVVTELDTETSVHRHAAESTFVSGQTIAINRADREKARKPEEPVLYRDCTSAVTALVETGEMDELMQYFEMCVSQMTGGSWSQTAFFAIVENVLISLKTELMRRYPDTEFAENALRHVNRTSLRATLNPEGFLRFIRNLLTAISDERDAAGQWP